MIVAGFLYVIAGMVFGIFAASVSPSPITQQRAIMAVFVWPLFFLLALPWAMWTEFREWIIARNMRTEEPPD